MEKYLADSWKLQNKTQERDLDITYIQGMVEAMGVDEIAHR